jgi:hypothetical protein
MLLDGHPPQRFRPIAHYCAHPSAPNGKIADYATAAGEIKEDREGLGS